MQIYPVLYPRCVQYTSLFDAHIEENNLLLLIYFHLPSKNLFFTSPNFGAFVWPRNKNRAFRGNTSEL
jgi:hypothetical protein